MLVLESEEHALRRGARIYCELSGFALSNDAFHMTAPRPDGSQAARAMIESMRDAEIEPSRVTYVNAHGSSTPLNDSTETGAIKNALGDRAYQIPVSGTKAMTGHSLGATGAIEAAICALSIDRNWVPATVNLSQTGEGCDLDYVPNHGRKMEHDCVVSNSFGFGGINASVVMQRCSG